MVLPHAFTALPIDWLIFIIIATVLTVYSIWAGTSRAAAIAFALPISSLLWSFVATTAFLGRIEALTGYARAAAFGILFIIIFFLVHRSLRSFGDPANGPFLGLLAGIAGAIVIVAMWPALAPLQMLWHIGGTLALVFAPAYRLFWILATYIVLAYVRS